MGEAESLITGPRSNLLPSFIWGGTTVCHQTACPTPGQGHVELVLRLKWGFGSWWCSEQRVPGKKNLQKIPLFNIKEVSLQTGHHTSGYPYCKRPIYCGVSTFSLQLRLAVILYMNKSFVINDYFFIFS